MSISPVKERTDYVIKMKNSFSQEIEKFLRSHEIQLKRKSLFRDELFPSLCNQSNNIVLHCISLQLSVLKNISPDYFSKLSDEAERTGLRLVHIWQDVWLMKRQILESRLLSFFHLSKRLYARNSQLQRLDKAESNFFLEANHLQGATSAFFKFGLKQENHLVAVATFAKGRMMTDSKLPYRSYEMERFANRNAETVVGAMGKLIEGFTRQYKVMHLMTYSDRDLGTGEVYRKLGFEQKEILPAMEFLVHPKECIRFSRKRMDEGEYRKRLQNGYMKIYNAGSLKWIRDLRN